MAATAPPGRDGASGATLAGSPSPLGTVTARSGFKTGPIPSIFVGAGREAGYGDKRSSE